MSAVSRLLSRSDRVLRLASVLALIGLALMVWSVVDPKPFPLILGLSVGQGIGTLSFVLFLVVVAIDTGMAPRPSSTSTPPPSAAAPSSEPPAE